MALDKRIAISFGVAISGALVACAADLPDPPPAMRPPSPGNNSTTSTDSTGTFSGSGTDFGTTDSTTDSTGLGGFGGAGGGGGGGDDDAGAGGSSTAGDAGNDARVLGDASQIDAAPPNCEHPETDAVFCARMNKNCGAFTGIDNCGLSRTTSCGICLSDAICGGGGTLNVCSGAGPINRAQHGVVTSSDAVDIVNEDMGKAFDGDATTKWIALGNATPWIAYQFGAGEAYAITTYTITSANDFPGRDPYTWELDASNDGVNWTAVDKRANQIFGARRQTNVYSFNNTKYYMVYMFKVLANGGLPDCQLSEIQFFGNPAPVMDAGASVRDARPETSVPDASGGSAHDATAAKDVGGQ